jgi:beta-lactamase class A
MFHCNGWCFPWTVAARAGVNVCLRKVDAQAMFNAMRDHGVTHYCGAPSVHGLLVNAPAAMKAGVPAGWSFLHKTGTGQILPPVSTGYNDIGIMTAPDGTRYAIAVMMGSTTASIPQRMTFMQFVSRTVASHHQN